jgi:hypothetical protein
MLLKLLHKVEWEKLLPKSFYETSIISIPTNQIREQQKENYRIISLKKIIVKILKKMLANRIQQHFESSYTMTKLV